LIILDFDLGSYIFSFVDYIFIDDSSLLIRKGIYSETSILMEEKHAVLSHLKNIAEREESY